MDSDVEKAKRAWEEADRILRHDRSMHRASPTIGSKRKLVAAADRWEKAASAWSAAIDADGNRAVARLDFVKATTLVLRANGDAVQR